MNINLRFSGMVFASFLLAVCGPVSDHELLLEDVYWELMEFDGQNIDAEIPPYIFFHDGHASGFGGCNQFGAAYTVQADGYMSFRRAISTRMFCEGYMHLENSFFQMLSEVEGYRLEDRRLVLLKEGQVLGVFSVRD